MIKKEKDEAYKKLGHELFYARADILSLKQITKEDVTAKAKLHANLGDAKADIVDSTDKKIERDKE